VGHASGRNSLAGYKGRSIFVQVPRGVEITDALTNEKVGEILSPSDKILVARGGGGATHKNQFKQEKGQNRTLNIDLKTISDYGFIGFPNAGKSSLLTKLSKAKPAISPFPFTTIQPEIGILEFEDHRQISLADLPGIIEGAHNNEGRGHVFLKHAVRTNCLLLVADVSGFQLSPKHKPFDCFETIKHLGKELELYDPQMLEKPMVLAINKMDLPDSDETFQRTVKSIAELQDNEESVISNMKFKYILPVSADSGKGVDNLKTSLRRTIDDNLNPEELVQLKNPVNMEKGKKIKMKARQQLR